MIVEWKNDQLQIHETGKMVIIKAQNEDDNITFKVDDENNLTACEGSNGTASFSVTANDNVEIELSVDCQNKTITLILKINGQPSNVSIPPIRYCDDTKMFTKRGNCKNVTDTIGIKELTQIPFPYFEANQFDTLVYCKNNRYLFIDANPNPFNKWNTTLYKRIKDPDTSLNRTLFRRYFEKARTIPLHSSLTVYIRGYNFHNLEEITVEINGKNYSFDKGLKDIYNQVNGSSDNQDDQPKATSSNGRKDHLTKVDYFNDIISFLDTISSLNINDLYVIEAYKAELRSTIDKGKIKLTPAELKLYNEILGWFPDYVCLTPTNMTIPDSDEVEIMVKIKHEGDSEIKTHKAGHYRVSGGFGLVISDMIFGTDLKNNEAYTENRNGELVAVLDDTKGSFGLGVNAEVLFRTGYAIRPTLNVGFFIPFEEDLDPFFAFGSGFAIINSKVKLSFSGGLTWGKINQIKPRYDGVDLTPFGNLTNTDLTEKVWQNDFYWGIGLSYNLSKK
ncbi:MAG: hypothetical protein DHS20C13_29940 [Thermodesulfobacteriota bacterium]|nr:MAG: hypothetical protein DHS20C13_29940 [Thermodesulfobacteriota bacterium]